MWETVTWLLWANGVKTDALDDGESSMGGGEKIYQFISSNDPREGCLFLNNGFSAFVDWTVPSMEEGNFSGT